MFMHTYKLFKNRSEQFIYRQDIEVSNRNPSYPSIYWGEVFFCPTCSQDRNLNEDVGISMTINIADCTQHE